MKRILLPLVVAGVLLAPSAAWATGTHTQPPRTPEKPCQCCEDLSLLWGPRFENHETRINQLEQQLAITNNKLENTLNWINEVNNRVSITINRLEALSCQSDRVYEFRLRRTVDDSPITAVTEVRVAGTTERGSVRRNGDDRWVITANYQGIFAPRLQFRTVMVHVRTADGREHDLVQYVRLCSDAEGGDDGDPNDRPAQDRAGDN